MEYLEMWASDHRPIRICFSLERQDPHRGRFFFYKKMLSKSGLEKVVKECWGPDMIFRVALWTELTDADKVF